METERPEQVLATELLEAGTTPEPTATSSEADEGIGTWLLQLTPDEGIRIFSAFFAAACLLLLVGVLLVENRSPEQAVQPKEIAKELLALQNLRASGQMLAAKKGLQKYIEANPDDARAHFLLAQTTQTLGNYGSSLVHLEYATALDPFSVEYLLLFAEIYRRLGLYEQAVEKFSGVLVLKPADMVALTARMELNYALQRYDEMIHDAEFAILAHPDNTEAYYLHGRTMMILNRLDEATQSLGFVASRATGALGEKAKTWLRQIADVQKAQ